jgi:hypothetical protein
LAKIQKIKTTGDVFCDKNAEFFSEKESNPFPLARQEEHFCWCQPLISTLY